MTHDQINTILDAIVGFVVLYVKRAVARHNSRNRALGEKVKELEERIEALEHPKKHGVRSHHENSSDDS